MEPEKIIAYLMELRNYTSLERYVSRLLEEHDWKYIVSLLRQAKTFKELLEDGKNPLRDGIINDGLANLLHLNELYGLDVDYLEAFSDLKGAALDEIRIGAWEHAKDLLREQLKIGVTFFLDVEAMQHKEDLLPFIPDVLNARMSEVQELESHPPLSDVYSTYYGFSIIASGGVMFHQSGVPPELREKIIETLGEIGSVTDLTTKQLKFSSLAFRGCSPYLKMLLWNILKFCVGGYKSWKQSMQHLAELGDNRALTYIEAAIQKYPRDTRVERNSSLLYLLACMGKITGGRLASAPANRYSLLSTIVWQRYPMQKLVEQALRENGL
ncbi:MAG: hypothetical protein OEV85_05840 [Candidatus Thorarchaeota archaeon]|nr:hypothetical protein [Candidatus Thorarchaeota archaeon]